MSRRYEVMISGEGLVGGGLRTVRTRGLEPDYLVKEQSGNRSVSERYMVRKNDQGVNAYALGTDLQMLIWPPKGDAPFYTQVGSLDDPYLLESGLNPSGLNIRRGQVAQLGNRLVISTWVQRTISAGGDSQDFSRPFVDLFRMTPDGVIGEKRWGGKVGVGPVMSLAIGDKVYVATLYGGIFVLDAKTLEQEAQVPVQTYPIVVLGDIMAGLSPSWQKDGDLRLFQLNAERVPMKVGDFPLTGYYHALTLASIDGKMLALLSSVWGAPMLVVDVTDLSNPQEIKMKQWPSGWDRVTSVAAPPSSDDGLPIVFVNTQDKGLRVLALSALAKGEVVDLSPPGKIVTCLLYTSPSPRD